MSKLHDMFDNGEQFGYDRTDEEVNSDVSNCCSASVYDPSGESIDGRCKDCGEMCLIVGAK